MGVVVLLVRHAHAGEREDWTDDDGARPLTAHGRHQAEGLRALLIPYGVSSIFSSPALRCTQTVEPLAASLGLEVGIASALQEGSGAAAADLAWEADDNVVLCTHGDVIPEVLRHISLVDGLELPNPVLHAKGSAWVLTRSGGRFSSGRYLHPPGIGR